MLAKLTFSLIWSFNYIFFVPHQPNVSDVQNGGKSQLQRSPPDPDLQRWVHICFQSGVVAPVVAWYSNDGSWIWLWRTGDCPTDPGVNDGGNRGGRTATATRELDDSFSPLSSSFRRSDFFSLSDSFRKSDEHRGHPFNVMRRMRQKSKQTFCLSGFIDDLDETIDAGSMEVLQSHWLTPEKRKIFLIFLERFFNFDFFYISPNLNCFISLLAFWIFLKK
jgi:hypothetical protein